MFVELTSEDPDVNLQKLRSAGIGFPFGMLCDTLHISFMTNLVIGIVTFYMFETYLIRRGSK